MTAALLEQRRAPTLAGVKLILSILAAIAVLLTPAGSMSGGAAMAAMSATHDLATTVSHHGMASAPAMGHCADREQPGKQQQPESCCIVACSALPAEPARLPAFSPSSLPPAATVPADSDGLTAEAATPPPRLS